MEQNKVYKRTSRTMPSNVRMKISNSLKGVKKTPEHCKHISDGLRAETGGYWSHIAKVPDNNNGDNRA